MQSFQQYRREEKYLQIAASTRWWAGRDEDFSSKEYSKTRGTKHRISETNLASILSLFQIWIELPKCWGPPEKSSGNQDNLSSATESIKLIPKKFSLQHKIKNKLPAAIIMGYIWKLVGHCQEELSALSSKFHFFPFGIHASFPDTAVLIKNSKICQKYRGSEQWM